MTYLIGLVWFNWVGLYGHLLTKGLVIYYRGGRAGTKRRGSLIFILRKVGGGGVQNYAYFIMK